MWGALGERIEHVTNGVHLGTWLAPELEELLAASGVKPSAPPAWGNWEAVEQIDGQELWRVHELRKRRLAERTQLDPERLTIGFARRFATYKRAGLVFSDLERLLQLPVTIVVAGKAHPQDQPGKDVMQQIVQLSHGSAAGHVVFLEDYNMELAAEIVAGVDIWLNTPRRPHEASGTSGMKAAINGVLNFSVLDGWWAEAFDPAFGWAIEGLSDEEDTEQLYRVLEQEILPTWNDRDRWITMMKASIGRLSPVFSMQRAVIEYTERYYRPATQSARR
jgi:starch phosphorylase